VTGQSIGFSGASTTAGTQRKEARVMKLSEIEGIGEVYEAKLTAAGIVSVEALLQAGATAKGRQTIVETAGVSEKLILEWVNRADLARVKGIGSEYADLLESAGVDTVPELARRNAESLLEKLVALNKEKELVRRTPTLAQVSAWIAEAKTLPRILEY
jgi:predicted flap endonuclease-1-like 5' DNA nuclease